MIVELRQGGYTPEDLLEMEGGPRYELVNGRLVEKPMGVESAKVSTRLIVLLSNHADAHGLGEVLDANAGYRAFPHEPRRVRYPDLSFLRRERIPPAGLPQGHSRIAPDLAVEVLSPNDLAADIDERVSDYLRAGTPLVWVIDPAVRFVTVYRCDGTGGWRIDGQEVSGEDILPGFACPVAELFRGIPPRPVAELPVE